MKNNNDYKNDLKNAMDELYEDNPKSKKKNVDKQNKILNRILVGLIVALIGAICLLGYVVGKELFFNDNNPNPPIVNTPGDDENNDLDNNQMDNTDNNIQDDQINDDSNSEDEIVNDNQDDVVNDDTNSEDEQTKGEIDTTEFTSDLFTAKKFTVTPVDNQVRFDITCVLHEEGSIYLMDDRGLSIGPIELTAGTCDLYFEVVGNANYTLQYVSKNSEIIEYTITKEMVQDALK